jgi:hypothetical protein
MGRLLDCWAPLQHKYFQSLGKLTKGHSWAVPLIVQLWQLSWNQWDHRNEINKTPCIQRNRLLTLISWMRKPEWNTMVWDRQIF